MTQEAKHIAIGLAVVLAMFFWSLSTCSANAEMAQASEDPRKQIARDKHTSFCAYVMRPHQEIADLINAQAPHDMKRWMPIIHEWNRMVEAYRRFGCGDA